METLIVLYAMIIARPGLAAGAVLIALGATFSVIAATYIAIDVNARAHVDELTVAQADTPLTREDLTRDVPARTPVAEGRIAESVATTRPAPDAVTQPEREAQQATSPEEDDGPYDEYGVLRDYSHYLSESQSAPLASSLGPEFRLTQPDELAASHGLNPRPTRIIIPAINLDSRIVDLHLVPEGLQSRWQTANKAVGFHVGSATPGEIGNTVMSGHVNSPIRGEGDIFRRLDNIAPLLRLGQIVDIVLEAGDTRYLYRATDTTVLLPKDVAVFRPTDEPTLSLVTCAPATTYSHRFIVNAVLIGTAPIGA